MKKYIGRFFVFTIVLINLLVTNKYNINVSAHHNDNDDNNNCGTKTYYISNDVNNDKINVDFEDNRKRIDVSGSNGWTITKVELDVEDDNHSGFWKYAEGNLNNFNPHPGGKIKEARITLIKNCFTPTPMPTVTSCPASPTITPTFIPTSTPVFSPTSTPVVTDSPVPTQTPIATDDPCEGNCDPTSTPLATITPIPTVFDVCQNIDGIQTSVPDGKHLDAGNINCVEFSPSGPSDASSSSTSTSTNVLTPQVLGVSTMAATGVFEDAFFNSLFTFGSLLTSFGIMRNGKKKDNLVN